MNPNQGPANEALIRPIDIFLLLLLQDVADSLQIGVADSSEKGKDLPTTISLCAVMDALEEQNDQCTSSPDPGKGETFLLRVENPA